MGFAQGTINYSDGTQGRLLYIKPSFLPTIPADVRAYGVANSAFPHVSTTEQWFTESEFESYRALGAWQADEITKQLPSGDTHTLDQLMDAAARAIGQTK